MRPWRDTDEYVGLNPTIPQNDAGFLVEPPLSEPKALNEKEKNVLSY